MNVGMLIKKRRRHLGYTLEHLSRLSGLSTGYLSKIERSGKIPPLATLQRLASSFGGSVHDLLEEFEPIEGNDRGRNDIFIVRNRREPVPAPGEEDYSGYILAQLTNNYSRRYMSPVMMYIQPGATDIFRHDAEEFNYVIKGPIKLKYGEATHRLDEGDSFYFDSRLPHSFINDSDYAAMVLSIVYVYRKF